MRKTELIIFDCDGVLADSEVISADVLIGELRAFGLHLDAQYVYRHFVGKSFPGVAEIIRATFQVQLPSVFEDRYRSALIEAYSTQLCMTPGLVDMLDLLDCPVCVATSSSPPRVKRTLDLLGLSDRFGPSVFTASQVKRGKPAPDLFLFAARKMGTHVENCLVIEDSTAGVTGALAAGMEVWRYVGGSHFADQSQLREQTPTNVPLFDDWTAFYTMAPDLKASEADGI